MSESLVDNIEAAYNSNAKIKVIGVGGAGGNAIQEMINSQLVGVQFICANTDLQALSKNKASVKIQLGEQLTKGLGAGANPAVGRDAANESMNAIRDAIGDANMVFVTAGMGGGTGTGASPVIAQAAKELGALTVGVVSKPFAFEGLKKKRIAEDGLEELKKCVDSLIIIPNDRLVSFGQKKATFSTMMQIADGVLINAVRGITDVIMREGQINVDFNDVRTTMAATGLALMGSGRASGENRAREATKQAIYSPLLEDVSLESAKAILYNITATRDIGMNEVNEIGIMIQEAAPDPDINIIFGVVYDDSMGDDLQVTVIATGIEMRSTEIEPPAPKQATTTRSNVTRFPDRHFQSTQQQQMPEQEITQEDEFMQNVNGRRNNAFVGSDDRLNQSKYSLERIFSYPTNNRHTPGKESLVYDEDEVEIPAFLRQNAN